MLLATVKGTFKDSFKVESTTIHIYENDFSKYGKEIPTTKQEIFLYVWGIPGVLEAEIYYSPTLK